MFTTRECPKCGTLFYKAVECPDCRVSTVDKIQKDEPKMDLKK